MSSNLISSFHNALRDIIKMHSTAMHEYAKRILFVIGHVVTVTMLTMMNINDILMHVIGAIGGAHNDRAGTVITDVLANAFDNANIIIHAHTDMDYVPSCEVSIGMDDAASILAMAWVHILCMSVPIICMYHARLYRAGYTFRHEGYGTALVEMRIVKIGITAMYLTHVCWAGWYMNMSPHNYQELGHYEVDTNIDVCGYVFRYVLATWMHIYIMRFTRWYMHISIAVAALLTMSRAESFHYFAIAICVNAVVTMRHIYTDALVNNHAIWVHRDGS